MASSKALVVVLMAFVVVSVISAVEFEVGGTNGWVMPKKDESFFNEWASAHRFKVNDTLRFQYKKDSVIVVSSEEEYQKCRSSHPLYFSNNGDSLFTFDRPGLFYFISGISGHCERGQKMIIKVLDIEALSPPPAVDQAANSTHEEKKSGAISDAAPIAAIAGIAIALIWILVVLD